SVAKSVGSGPGSNVSGTPHLRRSLPRHAEKPFEGGCRFQSERLDCFYATTWTERLRSAKLGAFVPNSRAPSYGDTRRTFGHVRSRSVLRKAFWRTEQPARICMYGSKRRRPREWPIFSAFSRTSSTRWRCR